MTEKAKEAWENAKVVDNLSAGWDTAVKFWKDNELGFKLSAVAELTVEAAKKIEMPKAAPQSSKKVSKMAPKKATPKRAKRGKFF